MHDLFFSHTWRRDEKGRSTHDRAKKLAEAMRLLGWRVWLDADDLRAGHIDSALAGGIESSQVFVACLTEEYIRKAHRGLECGRRDSCAKEWCCAMSRGKPIVPVVFEDSLLDTSTWPAGAVTLQLAGCMYVDATHDDWNMISVQLHRMLVALAVVPIKFKVRDSGELPPIRSRRPHPRRGVFLSCALPCNRGCVRC